MVWKIDTETVRRRLRSILVILLIVVFAFLQLLEVSPIASLRYAFFDFAQRILPDPQPSAPITMVQIDNESLEAFGQWPWPRDRIAELIGMLARHKPAVIGIDIIFSEPDRLSPENLLSGYEVSPFVRKLLAELPTNDQALADSLSLAPTVLAVAPETKKTGKGLTAVSRTPINLKLGWQATPRLRRYPALLSSLPSLEASSAGSGIASVELDGDGVVRRLPAIVLVGDTLIPSFAVEIVRLYLGAEAVELEIDGAGVSGLSIAGREFQTDTGGNIWLRATLPSHMKRLSAAQVLFDRFETADIKDRIIIFGATGTGLSAGLVSAKGNMLTALDAQALFVENLLGGTYLQRSQLAAFLELVATLVGCVGIMLLHGRLRSYGGQAAVLAYAAFLFVAGLIVFETQRMIFDPSASIIAMLVLYLLYIGGEIVATQRERRRTEEARRTALTLAESASHAKTNFLTGMSHELRTPLNAIIGFSEMIKDGVLGPVSPPNYANYAKDINNAAVHLLGIVTQILDMANLEAGDMRLRVTEFEMKELLDESIQTIRTAKAEEGLTVTVVAPAVLPVLRADQRMVRQMLLNLILNASKFSPVGGTVRISTRIAGNGEFHLSVTDSGSGMSQKQVAEAFEMFQTSDQTLSDSTRGIGLGLPITTAMIEEHGGTIDVVSSAGQGTRMTLRFPANRVVHNKF